MLYFSAVTSLIFFILGGIIGWIENDVVSATTTKEETPTSYEHPEMYDANGNPYSGDLLHVRFHEQEVEDED